MKLRFRAGKRSAIQVRNDGVPILPTLIMKHTTRVFRNGPSSATAVKLVFLWWESEVTLLRNPVELNRSGDTHACSEMNWEDAPAWATHIVGLKDNSDSCFWSECVNGLYCDEASRVQAITGYAIDELDDPSCWVVYSERPVSL